jgi:hypothetical protein
VKKISLSQGQVAQVDDADFESLNRFKWFAQKLVRKCRVNWYAGRLERVPGRAILHLMHRDILGISDRRIEVDHMDGDGLNNQRFNLRAATHAQNTQNCHKRPNCSSRFKGVSFNRKLGKWVLVVQDEYLGLYTTEVEAAVAYNAEARARFGPFAQFERPE